MLAIITIIFTISGGLQASEIDSYTNRNDYINDGLIELNKKMDFYITKAIEDANKKPCSEDCLREILHKYIGGLLWTNYENEVLDDPLIDKVKTKKNDSVYRDFTIFEAFALMAPPSMGGLTRINDLYIGTDKFGHFIEQGYEYFLITRNGGEIEDALAYGEKTEREHYGLQTTGIYSYGDLVSNFEGLLFWQGLIGKPNIIPQPHITYENGSYRQLRPFDWSEYINAGWDEAVNCNRYKTPEMDQKVARRVKELEITRLELLSCPISKKKCEELIKFYGNTAQSLVSPRCFDKT